MSDATDHLAISVSLGLSYVVTAGALYAIGYGADTAGWYVLLTTFNVFAIPVAVVVETSLSPWMWYLVVVHWVGALFTGHRLGGTDGDTFEFNAAARGERP